MESLKSAPQGECAYVSPLAGHWIAIHKTAYGRTITISKRFESDKKVAEATAKTFAENNKIPYHNEAVNIKHPIFTICKIENTDNWYPAYMWANDITFMYEEVKGYTKETASEIAVFQSILSSGVYIGDCNIKAII